MVRHASGHWYFSLKDAQSQVRCVMFKEQNRIIPFTPKQGLRVIVHGRASLYTGRGDFQLVIHHMSVSGEGNLHYAFEQLKKKLLQEGLFEDQRKRPLPTFPKHVGVISSPSGAVIRDICAIFKRRWPLIVITLLPTVVQGKQAEEQIVDHLEHTVPLFCFDAIILARGGGSREDLQPFNEESVARAIAQCTTPIISSIGHKTDITIADFVADYQAPTPSAAAEILSPNQMDWVTLLQQYRNRLAQAIHQHHQQRQTTVHALQARLHTPDTQLQHKKQTN